MRNNISFELLPGINNPAALDCIQLDLSDYVREHGFQTSYAMPLLCRIALPQRGLIGESAAIAGHKIKEEQIEH